MIEEVPDTDDQPANQGANDDDMMREDAASETGTDDSGLVMALDQDSVNGQRDENNPSNNNMGAGHLNAGFSAMVKTSERTRSTISEDKAAVSFPFTFNIQLLVSLQTLFIQLINSFYFVDFEEIFRAAASPQAR